MPNSSSSSASDLDPNRLHSWDHQLKARLNGLRTLGTMTAGEWWQHWELDASNSVAIGAGVHGKAFAAHHPSSDQVVAAKVIPLRLSSQSSHRDRTSTRALGREIFMHDILSGLPGFVEFHGCSIVIGPPPLPAKPPPTGLPPAIFDMDSMHLPIPAVHAVLVTEYAGRTVSDILERDECSDLPDPGQRLRFLAGVWLGVLTGMRRAGAHCNFQHNDVHLNNIVFMGPIPDDPHATVIDFARRVSLVDYGRSGAQFDGRHVYYDFSPYGAKPPYDMFKDLASAELQRMAQANPSRDWGVYDTYIDSVFGLRLLPALAQFITRAIARAIDATPVPGAPASEWSPNPQDRQAIEVLMQGERMLGRFFLRRRDSELDSPAAMIDSICQNSSVTQEDLRVLDS